MGFKEFSDGVHEVDLWAWSEGNIDDLNIEKLRRGWSRHLGHSDNLLGKPIY